MNATPLPDFSNAAFLENKNIPLQKKPFAVLGEGNYCFGYQQGGMSEIYFVGSKNDLKPRFALKTFKKNLFYSAEHRMAFIHEASVWLRLSGQPFVFPAVGILKIEGLPYITMPVAEPNKFGEVTLRDRLNRKGEMINIEKYKCIYEITTGLYYANKEIPNLIHGDLKPENVMYYQGDLNVADFGLARVLSVGNNSSHSIKTTPAYQAPELVNVKFSPTLQSDQYALGLIFLEILLGRDILEIKRKNNSDPSFLLNIARTISSPLRGIIDVVKILLQKKPSDRYSNYHEVYTKIVKVGSENFGVQFNEIFVKTFQLTQFALDYKEQAFRSMIECLLNIQEFEVALDAFNKKDKSGLDGEMWRLFGTVLSLNNKDEQALIAYNNAAGFPMDEEQKVLLQVEKALSFKRLKQYDEALKIFKYYRTRVGPNLRANIEINYAATLYEMENYKEAITEMEFYTRRNDAPREAWAILGNANFKVGKFEEAIMYFKRCLTMDPSDAASQFNYGQCLFHLKYVEDAYRTMDAAMEQGFSSYAWFIYTFACQMLLGAGQDMIELSTVLKQNPKFTEAEEQKMIKDAIKLVTEVFPEYNNS